jgi:hypothetical protein
MFNGVCHIAASLPTAGFSTAAFVKIIPNERIAAHGVLQAVKKFAATIGRAPMVRSTNFASNKPRSCCADLVDAGYYPSVERVVVILSLTSAHRSASL